jgi:hypothetical protein
LAKNDIVLIDAILRTRSAGATVRDPGEVFERFVIEEALKNYDLSGDEIDAGWIDGAHDGGIDAFYTLVNGRPLIDPGDFAWPRSSAEIKVILFTCKMRDSFAQAPLDAILATVQEVFDLEIPTPSLRGKYSKELRACRDAFTAAFEQLSLNRPTLSFDLIYACRGDTSLIGDSVAARGDQIAKLLTSYFSAATSSFTPLGAAELVDMHRQVRTFALDLPIQEYLTAADEGYVVLSRLTDYCNFVRDEQGRLRRYLFDSNVRAFLGANLVNRDIAQTLADPASPNFWWLNNGVTILATHASLVGKTLKMKDIQIVNGLQTTESLHRNLALVSEGQEDSRTLLVKVIVSADERVRDSVIRATNNQTAVETSSLRATDRIQQDIEEVLLTSDWYYERRTNFFRNEGRPDSRIISPLLMATGSVALFMKNPAASSKFKQRQMRAEGAYEVVYSDHYALKAWPVAAAFIRAAELAIARLSRSDHLATWRGPLAYVAAVSLLGSYAYSIQQLADVKQASITDRLMDDCWKLIRTATKGLGGGKISEVKMQRICDRLSESRKIAGHYGDGRRPLPTAPPTPQKRAGSPYLDSEQLLSDVSTTLPAQPWPVGVHNAVASTLGVESDRVKAAIQELIRRGKWLRQRDGIVYDKNGSEVSRDPTRAQPE